MGELSFISFLSSQGLKDVPMQRFLLIEAIFAATILVTSIGCKSSTGKSADTDDKHKQTQQTSGNKEISEPTAEEQLRQSALDGNLEKVKEMINGGVNVNSPDSEGHTALMFAAFNGHSDIVLLLLESEAAIDRRDLVGRTALLYGSTGPFPETVKILLDKGAKPNIIDSEEHFSPLMHAAAEGNLDVVKVLIEYGADPGLKDVDGDNAETFARQNGHREVADYISSVR